MKILTATAIATAMIVGQPLVGSAVANFVDFDGSAVAKGKDKAKSKAKEKSKRQKKVKAPAAAKPAVKPAVSQAANGNGNQAVQKPKNVNAQLKGLNSLKRNINGLMNSSDPKMAGFRAFVMAGGDLQMAQDALDLSQSSYDALAATYGSLLGNLGLSLPTDVSDYDALLLELQTIAGSTAPNPLDYTDNAGVFDQASYDAAVAQWTQDVADANQAITDYDAMLQASTDLAVAQSDFDDASAAVSEDALIQAIVDGMNASGQTGFTTGDVTQEMLDWVSQEMGVGDADGLMDDYLNSLQELADQVSADEFIGPMLPEDDMGTTEES